MEFAAALLERERAIDRSNKFFTLPHPVFTLRRATSAERSALRSSNNRFLAMDVIYFAIVSNSDDGGDVFDAIRSQIANNSFSKCVVLPLILSQSPSSPVDFGVFNSTVHNSILEPYSSCHNNGLISDTHVMPYAKLVNNGIIERDLAKENQFCTNLVVNVGPETGGRPLTIYPEATIPELMAVLLNPAATAKTTTRKKTTTTSSFINHRQKQKLNIIGRGAKISNTRSVKNVFIHPASTVENCSILQDAILMENATVISSVCMNIMLQWNCKVDNSDVRNSLMMEASVAGPNSTMNESILGPDSHVSSGEVINSLLGPSTNAHHQSLLISLIWPLGRGNVGYGANVGSNHTGRSADQEAWVGEGVFFGLSSVVKFPLDLSFSPYSIIAAGVDLLPQKILFPFSLVAPHADYVEEATGLPPQLNQLHPAWLLKQSPYSLARSEMKYKNRRKSKRHEYSAYHIMRPYIVDLCVDARSRLTNVYGKREGVGRSINDKGLFYTEEHIKGLGKNYITEKGRRESIAAYTKFIQRYCLLGFLSELEKSGYCEMDNDFGADRRRERGDCKLNETVVLPWQEQHNNMHWLAILNGEFPRIAKRRTKKLSANNDMTTHLLQILVNLYDDYCGMVLSSKQRDDKRGKRVIPLYSSAHSKAENDTVCMAVKEETRRVKARVDALNKSIEQPTSRL